MSEIRRDEIVYEEGWRDRKTDEPAPETVEETEKDNSSIPDRKGEISRPWLTILQLVLCMIAALVLFILKAMDSGTFHDFMQTYNEEMSKPVIAQSVFDAVDWNAIFGGSHAAVTSTPDERPTR